jgi:hypothetical protein
MVYAVWICGSKHLSTYLAVGDRVRRGNSFAFDIIRYDKLATQKSLTKAGISVRLTTPACRIMFIMRIA